MNTKMSTENKCFIGGKYYKLTSKHGEETIAYYYFNQDADSHGFGFNIADGGGFLPISDLISKSKVELVNICTENKLTASEAVYGFAAWLTCRTEKTIISSSDDAGGIATLVNKFCEENNLDDPRDDYHKILKHPKV